MVGSVCRRRDVCDSGSPLEQPPAQYLQLQSSYNKHFKSRSAVPGILMWTTLTIALCLDISPLFTVLQLNIQGKLKLVCSHE